MNNHLSVPRPVGIPPARVPRFALLGADEPDRAGIWIALTIVLGTLAVLTVALGVTVLFG